MSNKKPFEHEIDPEFLGEICQREQQGDTEPVEYRFSNPDPYVKYEPLPFEHRRHSFWLDKDGHIRVKNLSAYWIPELTVTEEITGTVYTVSGSYEGTETFVRKLERTTAKKFTEKMEGQE